ncbi:MAG: F0F1 ATP synthase subunit A [Rickettsiales bacterium]
MSAEHGSHSPLEQFAIVPIHPINIAGYDVSFTNSSLWMVLAVAAIIALLLPASRKRAVIPGRLQSSAEMLIEFINSTILDAAGKEGLKYFPIIFSLFVFILTCNLLGMVPGAFTVTSHIIVTFALAAFVFIGVTLIAIFKHGIGKFLHFFLPEGTPIIMAPLLFIIEFFSYLSRPVSLSIRLAANMVAGHVTMKVIAGLIITFGMVIGISSMFPLLLFLTGFEIAIAIIQAYIFTILTCVYLNDALHLH